MLAELFFVTSQACQNGQCPNTMQSLTVATTVTKTELISPFATNAKTTVHYRRNLFGRLVPMQATVVTQAKKGK